MITVSWRFASLTLFWMQRLVQAKKGPRVPSTISSRLTSSCSFPRFSSIFLFCYLSQFYRPQEKVSATRLRRRENIKFPEPAHKLKDSGFLLCLRVNFVKVRTKSMCEEETTSGRDSGFLCILYWTKKTDATYWFSSGYWRRRIFTILFFLLLAIFAFAALLFSGKQNKLPKKAKKNKFVFLSQITKLFKKYLNQYMCLCKMK